MIDRLPKITRLKPIDLSQVEYEDKKQDLNEFVESKYGKLNLIDINDYAELREKFLNGDKKAEKVFQEHTFRKVIDEIIELYLNFDLVGYEFEDAVQDVMLLACPRIATGVKAPLLIQFDFFMISTIKRDFLARVIRHINYNLDNAKYVLGDKLVTNEESHVSFNEMFKMEDVIEQRDAKEQVKLILGFLKAKETRIVKLVFGIDEKRAYQQYELGKRYNVTRGNIWNVYKDAMKKLKQPMSKLIIESGNRETFAEHE